MRPHHANHTLRALLLALLLTGATAGRPLLQADPPAAGDTDAPEAAPQLTVAPKVLGDPIPSSADGFVAALMKDGHATCGGALIAPNVVLTAAHCVTTSDGALDPPHTVRLNWPNLHEAAPAGGEEWGVDHLIVHPSWLADPHPAKGATDLALIVLLDGQSAQTPVALPDAGFELGEGEAVWAAGYSSNDDGSGSRLERVQLETLSFEQCTDRFAAYWEVFYEATPEILSLTVCTQAQEAGQATCKGDSGGPLVVDRDGGRTLVGALSWGTSATCIDAPEDATDYFASLVNSDSREWVGQQLEQLGGGDA